MKGDLGEFWRCEDGVFYSVYFTPIPLYVISKPSLFHILRFLIINTLELYKGLNIFILAKFRLPVLRLLLMLVLFSQKNRFTNNRYTVCTKTTLKTRECLTSTPSALHIFKQNPGC